jgi:hypothetical protein
MFVCCECCVFSGRDLCDGLITRPEGFCGASKQQCVSKPKQTGRTAGQHLKLPFP